MDCPDCASKIEKVLNGLPGITAAQVDFASETLSAQLDTPQQADALRRAVRTLGYDITDQSNRVSSVLEVQGMDCAEEKTLVEKALKDLSGLERFEINLMTARLTVIHDSATLPVAQIITALADVGLRATTFGAPTASGKLWQRHGRLLSTIAAGVFVAVGLVLHLLVGQEGVWEKSLYVLAIVSGGWFIARKGVAAIRHGAMDMNFLMTVAVIGALIIDAWDEAAMVVFLFALAQVLEGRAMDRARHAVRALMNLAPPVALRIQDDTETTVAVDQIQIGDVIRIRPGEKIPLDGAIIDGRSAVNQAPITGESVPVDKAAGDTVFAGAINGSGSLDVRVSHKSTDTTLAHIIHLIEQAQSARAPAQAFVDRFSKIYTPAVLVLAALIALLPPLLFDQSLADWFYRALVLLVIACPCALVISTPVAIVSGLARGARAGVLLKGGVHLENAGHLKAIAFDKTGTLTIGRPEVQTTILLNNTSEAELLGVAASLETRSEHPLALAILDYAKERNVSASKLEDFQALPGRGVEALVDGQRCLLGNHRLFEERGLCTAETEIMLGEQERQGQTVVIVGNDRQILGLIAIADSVRPEARGVVTRLHQLGIAHITMLTGDNQGTAWAIAGQLGIDSPKAELLPADKVTAIQQLVQRFGQVGMVGDGVNDAPAMAAATTGIAMGAAGTDAALETADVVLMGDDLTRLPFAIRLSRTTLSVIRSNITLALGLKAIFLVLAVLGLATLWMAVFADAGASLLVIANSLRLLRMRDH
ncbi:MAG TPA: cadmium-translocating P-type ATPase [Acidiferrobacteraceae bacterium]|nr:cadmium-translocating P-type ATPase [Acidiferrobacteraceae bacterium]HEX20711.1 cadmium-translocating P-type ATPase [Acidiferrobacteraceae bacterium]